MTSAWVARATKAKHLMRDDNAERMLTGGKIIAALGLRETEKRQMTTSTRYERETTIVDVVGQIDLASSPAFRKALLESLEDTRRLAVNLLEVRYIDSSGIATLVEVLKEARKSEKRLVLFGLSTAVRQVLQLTRLTGIFEICETEGEVLSG